MDKVEQSKTISDDVAGIALTRYLLYILYIKTIWYQKINTHGESVSLKLMKIFLFLQTWLQWVHERKWFVPPDIIPRLLENGDKKCTMGMSLTFQRFLIVLWLMNLICYHHIYWRANKACYYYHTLQSIFS